MARASSICRPTHNRHIFRWGGSRLVAPVLLSSWWGAPPSFGERQWAFERVIGPETVPHLI
jgi:hypothetical protein